LRATGRLPTVLLREGWTWDEVFCAAGIEMICEGLRAEAARGKHG